MKECILIQQASFGLKCSRLLRVFYCMHRGNGVDLEVSLYSGLISPELWVKFDQPFWYSFDDEDHTRCHKMIELQLVGSTYLSLKMKSTLEKASRDLPVTHQSF